MGELPCGTADDEPATDNSLDTLYAVVVNGLVVEVVFTTEGAANCLKRNWNDEGSFSPPALSSRLNRVRFPLPLPTLC
jgi:hypothetical protein